MLVSGLRMLLCAGGVFLALGMITLAMMFSGGTMRLGSVFVVFGRLVVFVSCHFKPRWLLASQSAPNHYFPNCSCSLRRNRWKLFSLATRGSGYNLSFKIRGSSHDRRPIPTSQSRRPCLLGSRDDRSWHSRRGRLERGSPLIGMTGTPVQFGTTTWRKLSGCRLS
jgi:hypothetical protein